MIDKRKVIIVSDFYNKQDDMIGINNLLNKPTNSLLKNNSEILCLNMFNRWLYRKLLAKQPEFYRWLIVTPSLLRFKTIFLFPEVLNLYYIDSQINLLELKKVLQKKFETYPCYRIEQAGKLVELIPYKFNESLPINSHAVIKILQSIH